MSAKRIVRAVVIGGGAIDEPAASIAEGRPIVTGIGGHNTLAVIETAGRSAEEKKWLEGEYENGYP